MDFDVILRFVVALIFVLGLIGLLSWAARRFGLGGRAPIRPGRRRRTMLVEATAIDTKRRLVLLRRDDVEHLVLLGPSVDLVIEQGIPTPEDDTEPEDPGSPTGRSGRAAAPARDFASELRARLRLGTATRAVAPPPPAPKSTPPSAKRRPGAPSLRDAQQGGRRNRDPAKSKLSQLKPARVRLGKQPAPKR